jgi:hypothetical protein
MAKYVRISTPIALAALTFCAVPLPLIAQDGAAKAKSIRAANVVRLDRTTRDAQKPNDTPAPAAGATDQRLDCPTPVVTPAALAQAEKAEDGTDTAQSLAALKSELSSEPAESLNSDDKENSEKGKNELRLRLNERVIPAAESQPVQCLREEKGAVSQDR